MKRSTLLTLLAIVAHLSSTNTQATTAPGFESSTTVFCRQKLQLLSTDTSHRFSHRFLSLRRQAQKLNPQANGSMNSALLTLLGIGTAPNNKISFLQKLWWFEDELKIHPNLKPLGQAAAEWAKTTGAIVPHHRGEMLFAGPGTQARLSVSIVEGQKALSDADQKKVPYLKPKGKIQIVINDSSGNLNKESFQGWIKGLIEQSKLDEIAIHKSRPDHSNPKRLPVYKISTTARPDGSTDYQFELVNVNVPNFHLTWLIENAQRSLALDDYLATHETMERTLGVPAHPYSGVDSTPFRNSTTLRHVSSDLWDQFAVLTPLRSVDEEPSGKGRKKKKPERRQKASYYD